MICMEYLISEKVPLCMERNSISFLKCLISVDAPCELQTTYTSKRFSSLQGTVAQCCTVGQNIDIQDALTVRAVLNFDY